MSVSGSISTMANNLLVLSGMPLSICQLVCDLLEAGNEASSNSEFTSLEDILDDGNESCSSFALASVEEALGDLSHMKTIPQMFCLFDHKCPKKALNDTYLFGTAAAVSRFERSFPGWSVQDGQRFAVQGDPHLLDPG